MNHPGILKLLILPFLVAAISCMAQTDTSLIVFRQQLRQDLPLFKQIITGLHPVYNKPGIKEQVSEKLDSLYRLGMPLTIAQVGSVFHTISIGDGCSDTHNYFKWRPSGLKVWPYAVRIIGKRVFINQDSVALPFGTEVMTINGRPVGQLLDHFYSMTNGTGLDSITDLTEVEAGFPVIWSEEYGPQESFDVEYRSRDRVGHTTLAAIPMETYFTESYSRRATPSAYWKDEDTRMIDEEIDTTSRTAFLYLNSFFLSPDSLQHYLDRFFDRLRVDSIRSLVIDLSRNGGGLLNEVPILYSYLTDRSFDFSSTLSADTIGLSFRSYLTGIDENPLEDHSSLALDRMEHYLWGGFKKTAANGYVENAFQTPCMPAATEKRFAGAVYILISGRTHSAACAFATLARVNKRALLFGTQAGGNVHFMDAAVLLQYQLPHSGLIFSVPTCYISMDFANSLPGSRCAMLEPDQGVSVDAALQMFLSRNANPPEFNKLIEYLGKNR